MGNNLPCKHNPNSLTEIAIIEYVSTVTYSHKCTSYAVMLERRTRI